MAENDLELPRTEVQLIAGDVLLMLGHGEISKMIAWCSDSRYSHAAIVADGGDLIEAAPKGVRRQPLAERLRDRENYHFVDAYRPLTHTGQPLTDEDRASVLEKADSLIGTAYPLDLLALIGLVTAIRGKVPRGLTARFIVYIALDHLLGDDGSKLMCSELVYRCLAECASSPPGKLAPVIVTSEATDWPFPDINWLQFLRELAQVIIPPWRYSEYFGDYLAGPSDLDSRVPRYPGRQIEDAIEEVRRRLAIPPLPDRNGLPVPHPNPKLITPLELTSTPSHIGLGRLMSG